MEQDRPDIAGCGELEELDERVLLEVESAVGIVGEGAEVVFETVELERGEAFGGEAGGEEGGELVGSERGRGVAGSLAHCCDCDSVIPSVRFLGVCVLILASVKVWKL